MITEFVEEIMLHYITGCIGVIGNELADNVVKKVTEGFFKKIKYVYFIKSKMLFKGKAHR